MRPGSPLYCCPSYGWPLSGLCRDCGTRLPDLGRPRRRTRHEEYCDTCNIAFLALYVRLLPEAEQAPMPRPYKQRAPRLTHTSGGPACRCFARWCGILHGPRGCGQPAAEELPLHPTDHQDQEQEGELLAVCDRCADRARYWRTPPDQRDHVELYGLVLLRRPDRTVIPAGSRPGCLQDHTPPILADRA
ncbi:hypothetical protein [Streptomyces sp. cg36]|uniref:hypothetical protein n=1 Tax=Streptomyces sp. cg36 TaxID=3238798 RepID=UPI0034E22321